MTDTTMSLADTKAHLSEVVGRVRREHERIIVTVHGEPAAVLLSPDDLESLEETLAILSDPEAVAALKESDEAIARGEVVSIEEVIANMRAAGRLV